jgi:hypothetical protein
LETHIHLIGTPEQVTDAVWWGRRCLIGQKKNLEDQQQHVCSGLSNRLKGRQLLQWNGEQYDWQDHRYPRSGCRVGVGGRSSAQPNRPAARFGAQPQAPYADSLSNDNNHWVPAGPDTFKDSNPYAWAHI